MLQGSIQIAKNLLLENQKSHKNYFSLKRSIGEHKCGINVTARKYLFTLPTPYWPYDHSLLNLSM